MKPPRVVPVAVAFFNLVAAHGVFAQGSLTPPGAPAPTMKTLDQVEPRTPIASLNFTINQSGSYYLVSNLTQSAAAHGILIGANHVTLDLNGFSLIGTNGSHDGIAITGVARTNILVRNGTIRNWRMGVNLGTGRNGILEDLRLSGNSQQGVNAGTLARVSRCIAGSNGSDGIRAGSDGVIEHCTSSYNVTNGIAVSGQSVVRRCEAIGNGGNGIAVLIAQPVQILDCFVSQNGGDGIRAQVYSLVQNNHCTQSGIAGIHITGGQNRIEGNHVGLNEFGILVDAGGNHIFRNTASNNSTNYSFTGSNMTGPGATGSGIVTNHPWANFSF